MFHRIKNGDPSFWIGVLAFCISIFLNEGKGKVYAELFSALSFGVFLGVGNNSPEWLKSIWKVRLALSKLERWKYSRGLAQGTSFDFEGGESAAKVLAETDRVNEEALFAMARDTLVLEEYERYKANGWKPSKVLADNAEKARVRLSRIKEFDQGISP